MAFLDPDLGDRREPRRHPGIARADQVLHRIVGVDQRAQVAGIVRPDLEPRIGTLFAAAIEPRRDCHHAGVVVEHRDAAAIGRSPEVRPRGRWLFHGVLVVEDADRRHHIADSAPFRSDEFLQHLVHVRDTRRVELGPYVLDVALGDRIDIEEAAMHQRTIRRGALGRHHLGEGDHVVGFEHLDLDLRVLLAIGLEHLLRHDALVRAGPDEEGDLGFPRLRGGDECRENEGRGGDKEAGNHR